VFLKDNSKYTFDKNLNTHNIYSEFDVRGSFETPRSKYKKDNVDNNAGNFSEKLNDTNKRLKNIFSSDRIYQNDLSNKLNEKYKLKHGDKDISTDTCHNKTSKRTT
jgi:hypothetical protein